MRPTRRRRRLSRVWAPAWAARSHSRLSEGSAATAEPEALGERSDGTKTTSSEPSTGLDQQRATGGDSQSESRAKS
eukprot:6497230-Prymnesium_polylepis.1